MPAALRQRFDIVQNGDARGKQLFVVGNVMFRQLRTEEVAVAPADQLRGGGTADQLREGLRGAGVDGVFIFNADKVRGILQKFFKIA